MSDARVALLDLAYHDVTRERSLYYMLERRGMVDRVVTVSEADLALAVVRLMELEKSVVEGAGAAPLAALLSGQLPELAGKQVVLTLCGGNIDLTILSRLIETALVADGRLVRFTAVISDRPAAPGLELARGLGIEALAVAVQVGAHLGQGETGVVNSPLIAKQFALRRMSRGVLDTRDMLYFFGVIAFFILLSRFMIERRKW